MTVFPTSQADATLATRIATAAPSRCDHLTVVECTGRDAADFLHGQLSNDVLGLAIGACALAAYLNPKGRVLGLMRVIREDQDRFTLVMESSLAATLTNRLRMFVLRAKVTLEHRADLRVAGFTATDALQGSGIGVPQPGQAVRIDDRVTLVAPGSGAGRLLLITDLTFEELEDRLGTAIGDAGAWLAAQAVDGVPEVFAATSESFLPQAINLDLVGGVNFRKGCYPGQEIVARLRYLGKLKQRMVGIGTGATSGIAPGAVVLAGERKIGSVVLAAQVPGAAMWLGLASVTFADLDPSGLRLADATPLATFAPPYAIPEFVDGAAISPT